MSKYAIWDKQSPVITPIGEYLTSDQWKERYPVANVDSIKIVCGGGDINGAYFAVFSSMVEMYTKQGCDFSDCTTDQEYLDKIEEFEDSQNTASDESTAEERIAAALELQNVLSMDDVNPDPEDDEEVE